MINRSQELPAAPFTIIPPPPTLSSSSSSPVFASFSFSSPTFTFILTLTL